MDAWIDRYSFVKQHKEYNSALPRTKFFVLVVGISLLRNFIAHPQHLVNDYYYKTVKQLRSISITREIQLQRSLRVELYLLKFSPKCYKFLRSSFVKIINLTNQLNITNRRTFIFLDALWPALYK